MKFICFIFIPLLLLGCANKLVSENVDEIIYKKKDTKVIEIYNTAKSWVSSEDVDYLNKRNFKYGEFGGQLKFCSNNEYYCIAGGINVAVPKRITSQKEWSYFDRSCQVESVDSDQQILINCINANYSTRFTYKQGKGIIWFIRSSEPTRTYELIGERGLFATSH